jgi:formate dehydrogenase major subunit
MRDFIIPTDDRDMGTPAKAGAPVTLRIDGIDVTVPEGTSVMRAAAEAGIAVPKLCATDSVEAFGSCRLCVVEIEGRRGTPASCTTPVAEGMVVHTQGAKVKKIRRGVMELYISDHPLDCLTCAANGDCELQDMAGAVGLRDVRYEAPPEGGGSPTISRRGTPPARRTPNGSPRTRPTPISPMTRRNASSAAAACAPARRCRAPSR